MRVDNKGPQSANGTKPNFLSRLRPKPKPKPPPAPDSDDVEDGDDDDDDDDKDDVERLIDSQDNEYVISKPHKGLEQMELQEDFALIFDLVQVRVW